MISKIPLIAAIAALVALSATAPAHAGPVLDRTATCLETTPVCVDPQARDVLGDAAAADLAAQIERQQVGPMFVAVVPAEAASETGGSPEGFVTALEQEIGTRGTYAVIVGNRFRVDSDDPAIEQAADAAFAEHAGDGPAAVLSDLVDRAASDDPAARSEPAADVNPLAPLLMLGVLLLVLFVFFAGQRRTRRREEQEQLDEVKRVARDDLVALGDDLRSLDLDVEMPSADPVGKQDYGRAVDLYKQAQEAFDTARRPEDLEPVAEAVEQGRYYVASARERLAGRTPPERRPPCFFDPRHGPSARDVEWAPPGGAPRPVPACEADAQRVERGLEPHVREIEYAGGYGPYWSAPAYYGPWAGGFFGGFGGAGFLGGLLLGNMLGGGLGWGGAMYSDADFFGGGDFGGGDFGGGDFGGGGFGGGDFGGGGFGGGDF